MLLDQDLSGLMESKYNPAIWHLLWLLLAPAFWMIHRWYMQLAADRAANDVEAAKLIASAPGLAAQVHKQAQPTKLSPERIAEIWRRYPGRWAVAGGWALDLFLGRTTREHTDIEVTVLRRERSLLWDYLLGWQPRLCTPDSMERIPWMQLSQLEPPVHKLRADPPQWDVADLEIHLSEADGEDWVFSRDPRVRLPLARAMLETPDGIPYIAPEIVLLYKSKAPRPVDEQDFAAVLPALNTEQRRWLSESLILLSPDHAWLLVNPSEPGK